MPVGAREPSEVETPEIPRRRATSKIADAYSRVNSVPLSFHDGLGPEIMNTDICQTYIHQKRIKDFSIKETTLKSRINLPLPKNKTWGKVDHITFSEI